jgi:thiol-disulfide isomerase/thioredoxin
VDRLHALTCAALAGLAAGCEKEGGGQPAAQLEGRGDVASVKPRKKVTVEELCDVRPDPGAAPRLVWPELSGPAPAGGRARWINLWATWCVPCVEEMPQLSRWHASLGAEGIAFDLAFVSVDADDAVVAEFRKRHADLPAGPRIARAEALPGFLTSLGLDAGAPIPVLAFVGADDRVRCVRAGAMKEADLDAVRQVLR